MQARRIMAGLAALVVALGITTVTLRAEAAAVTSAFGNTDVGFSEGSATGGLVDRLDQMDTYVGDRKPIVRLDLNWWRVQQCAGCTPDFEALDPIVDAASARGIRVLLILDYAPPWANGDHANDHWFPLRDSDWTGIVDATVAHFGGKVQAYEVWNEPNFAAMGNFGDGSVASRRLRYWQLVKLAYDRVHAACAGCVILAGASGVGDPISTTRNDNESAAWLDWAYANNYGGTFDAVTHHPYPAWNVGFGPARPECTTRWWNMFGPPDEKCGELAAVRAVMVKHGDTAKKIWATEFGYPSSGAGMTAISAEQRRDNLEEGVRMWRALDYAGPLFVFSFADSPSPGCVGSTDPECHFGLVDAAGTAKQPAFDSLRLALTDTRLQTLAAGRSLHRTSALRSTDGRFELWLQGDGNLVLYQGTKVLWKVTNLKAVRLTNQPDGSLALFDGTGKKVWNTATAGKGVSTLIMQNDGNLVLYPAATPSKASWASGSCCH